MNAPLTELPVEHLMTMEADTVTIPPVFIPGAPQGTRLVASVSGGTFTGPRLSGTVLGGSGGDWVHVRADGSFKLDVRLVLRTDDDAPILVTYNGIGREVDGALQLRAAPLFETGDERYSWLNLVQAVSFGSVDERGVRYDIYAVR